MEDAGDSLGMDLLQQVLDDLFLFVTSRTRGVDPIRCRPRARTPLWRSSVASPPSSTINCGPLPPGRELQGLPWCSHQYSSRRLALPGKDGNAGGLAIAAAAWSCVEKMLQAHPADVRAKLPTSDSMRTAVWIVMCNDPMMRTPSQRLTARPYFSRSGHQAGHLVLGNLEISLRPKSARPMSATL